MTHDTIYLCEKPSQARDIARILGATQKTPHYLSGAGVTVTWCFGHLLEMAAPDHYGDQYKRWTIEALPIVPATWRLDVRPKVKQQYNAIAKLIASAPRVIVATDADREGETIAREILDRCNYQGTVDRLWLSALDDASIRSAIAHLRDGAETVALYHAGLGRARADWLVGMNLTRAYTVVARDQGHDRLLPVGRVQTPTLRLVVDLDQRIEAFKPVPYWDVIARFQVAGKGSDAGVFTARWQPPAAAADDHGRCLNERSARDLAQCIAGATGRITRAETKRERQAAPLPYDLGTLQQEASRVAGMGAQQVLDTVQALYERHKAVTYPRTDCRYLPQSMHGEAAAVLDTLAHSDSVFAPRIARADAARQSKTWNDKKITAHHAMIPTAAVCDPSRMSADERCLYGLIRARYVAQFYPDHEVDRTTLSIEVAGAAFRATGKQLIVEGWAAVNPAADAARGADAADNAALPVARDGDGVCIRDTDVQGKKTQPPARYTEGTLIAAMKNAASRVTDPKLKQVLKDTAGLGTEATRAGMIKTLLDRGFLAKQKKHLISTPPGRALISVLPQAITNPETTALWEQALDDVSAGRLSLDDFVARQTKWVHAALDQVRTHGLNLPQLAPAKDAIPCLDCGRPMRKRQSKHGAFYGCTGYPDCKATQPAGRQRRSATARGRAH